MSNRLRAISRSTRWVESGECQFEKDYLKYRNCKAEASSYDTRSRTNYVAGNAKIKTVRLRYPTNEVQTKGRLRY